MPKSSCDENGTTGKLGETDKANLVERGFSRLNRFSRAEFSTFRAIADIIARLAPSGCKRVLRSNLVTRVPF